jgi:putative ABC transport system permease protein
MWANTMPVRPPNFRAWKEQAHSFQQLSAWRDENLTVTDPDNNRHKPEQIEAGTADVDLFPMLGIKPRMGRGFAARDAKGGQSNVAILSDELYRSRFNSDPRILGASIFAGGKPYTIIGILPAGVAFPAIWGGMEQKKPQLWLPLRESSSTGEEQASSLYVFGRLKDGVSVEQARAEMRTIESHLSRTPLEEGGFGINVETLRQANTDPSLKHAVIVLQIAVLFVLLIACANAGNLLLGKAVSRDKEMAVRTAIGASGWGLLRQTLTESMLLSCGAAVVGLLLSLAGLQMLTAMAPSDAFALHELRIDESVLLFTALIAFLTGIVFGLIPASHSWNKDINEVLNRSTRGVAGSSTRLRTALVVAEIALSLVLVVGAGLMIRSLSALMKTDLGFRIDHLLVMRVTLPQVFYQTPEKLQAFNNRLIESVRNVNGIESAALTTALPMKSVSQSSFEIPGRPKEKDKIPVTDWARVSDGYFETLKMQVREGRTFTRAEVVSPEPEVAVVNEAFARKFFPGEKVLRKQVRFANEKGAATTYQVVGVVANEHQMGPDNELGAEIYLPGQHLNDMLLVARTVGNPLNLAGAVKQQVWNIDKDQPVKEVMTEEDALRSWSEPRRFNLTILLVFAGIALLLAAMGLYSVLAYTVTLRTREIGVRVAIGAEPRDVARYIMRGGLMLSIAGIGLGIGLSIALTRYMSSLLFGVSAVDPLTFVSVAAVLLVIAMAASYLPALRAAKIDPIEALRIE